MNPRPQAPSPVVDRIVTGHFREGAGYDNWRSHGTTDWLLIHTLDGAGRFGLPDGSGEALTQPGDVVLIRPDVPHDYGTSPGGLWDLQFAHFHPRTDWLPLLDWPELAPGFGRTRLAGETRRRVESALGRAVSLSNSGLDRADLFAMNAVEEALLWAATGRPGPGRLDSRLVSVLELIGSRLAEPLDVDRMAGAVGLSGSRLAHLFRDELGLSPRDFVERQRMQAAEQLLQLSARSVSEVATAVGYDDPLYFSARFKRYSGQPPTLYRRLRSGADPAH